LKDEKWSANVPLRSAAEPADDAIDWARSELRRFISASEAFKNLIGVAPVAFTAVVDSGMALSAVKEFAATPL
jgi:hypothetical protein